MKKILLVGLVFCLFALSAFAQDSSSDTTLKVTVKLHVGNLASKAKESDLKAFFNRAGVEVTSAQIFKKNVGGQARNFGLVEVAVEQAENAVKLTNGKQFMGRALAINIIATDRQKVEDVKNASTPPTTTPTPTAIDSPSPVATPTEQSPISPPTTPTTPAEPTAVESPSPAVVPPTTPPTPEAQQTPTVASSTVATVPTTTQATIAPVKSAATLRADELIRQNIQSRGGWDKLKAINTIRMTGIQTFDGKDGWILNPFLGKTEAEPITTQQLEDLKTQADFEGMLIDYEAKGSLVEFAGDAELEGTPTYKLKVTKKNGNISFVWLDAQSYLEIQSSAKTNVNGQEVEAKTTFGDFKETGGVLFAHSMQTKSEAAPAAGMTLAIEKIVVNPILPAARFGKP